MTLPILVLSPMLQELVGLRDAIRFPGDAYVEGRRPRRPQTLLITGIQWADTREGLPVPPLAIKTAASTDAKPGVRH